MHLANGEYLSPYEQSYLQWDAKQDFLDSVTRMNPQVLEGLRHDVFPSYPSSDLRAAIYFFRHYSRLAANSQAAIAQEIPKFAYRMALAVSPYTNRQRFTDARRYLDTYPRLPEELVFTDHDWDDANVLQDWERTAHLRFDPERFTAEFAERVPRSSMSRFAKILAEEMSHLRTALEDWGEQFQLTSPWVYSNALETMLYGAFTPKTEWFPTADRWEFTDDHYFAAEPPEPPDPALVSRHSFIWDPRNERRRDARARLSKLHLPITEERELVADVARVAQAYHDAGWYQAPLSRLERHHFDWTALAITKHLTVEQMLGAYMERLQELGEWQAEMANEPALSSIHRGISRVCNLVDLPSPLRQGRPRRSEPH